VGYDWTSDDAFTETAGFTMNMPESGDMKVLLLSDLHISFFFNDKTFKFIDKMIKRTDPNLIVLMGDNVGYLWNHKSCAQFIKRIDSYKIPWAPIIGNHDGSGKANRNYIAKMLSDATANSVYCMFNYGPNSLEKFSGNYFVNLKNGGDIAHTLYMISSGKQSGEGTHYPRIPELQTKWLEWAQEGNGYLPSSIFTHIPLKEFDLAWQSGEHLFGERHEKVYGPDDTADFFASAKSGGTKNIFAAHDHYNNYSVMYQGVQLTYTLHSSFSRVSYEYWGFKKIIRGGTMLTIKPDGTTTQEHIYA
jgi:hypothetical protein